MHFSLIFVAIIFLSGCSNSGVKLAGSYTVKNEKGDSISYDGPSFSILYNPTTNRGTYTLHGSNGDVTHIIVNASPNQQISLGNDAYYDDGRTYNGWLFDLLPAGRIFRSGNTYVVSRKKILVTDDGLVIFYYEPTKDLRHYVGTVE